MNPDLDRLQSGLIAAISAQITPKRGLNDPHLNGPSPPDHYGHTAAALALAAHDRPRWNAARDALNAWHAIDDAQIGHQPFNRLMLLLLARVATDTKAYAADTDLIAAAIGRCTLRKSYPSNNWSLLAQTCRLIEASEQRRPAEADRFRALLDRWTTTAGAFIDFPARPAKHFSTPIAYHHKALFLTALAAWFHDDPALVRHAKRLLDWLVHCWDPAGYAGGVGRSNHALFGDGCLLAALIMLGFDTDDDTTPVGALARRMEHQRRPDGLLWLTPAGPESGDASWDRYMHLSVYNAWTAALVSTARHLRRHAQSEHRKATFAWRGADIGCFHDPEAGIVYLRSEAGLNALVTTHGQPPQSFSRDEVDFRYAGGVIAHFSIDGIPLVSPPVRCSRKDLIATPALAGWTPVLQQGDDLFALSDFDRVTVEPRESGVSILLLGRAVALCQPTPKSLIERVVASIDWRLLGGRLGRRASLERPHVESISATLRLDIGGSPATVVTELKIEAKEAARLTHLNPHGYGLAYPAADAFPWLTVPILASLVSATGRCLGPKTLGGKNHFYRFRIQPASKTNCAIESSQGA